MSSSSDDEEWESVKKACCMAAAAAAAYARIDPEAGEEPDAHASAGRRGANKRETFARGDYDRSVWYHHVSRMRQQLANGGAVSARDAKLWRRRFRVPFHIFEDLVATCRTVGIGPQKLRDAAGRATTPLDMKVCGVLRVLGRASFFDDCAECTFISENTHRVFFHEFCKKFSISQWKKHVHPPETPDEIKETLDMYAAAGFPGCVGSIDCVHIAWGMCPTKERSWFKGKEGWPTIVYEVVTNHATRIFSATPGHPGTCNDKTTVRFDSFVQDMHKRGLYKDVEFTLRQEDGSLKTMKGLYLICDGGYHKWRCLQCAARAPESGDEYHWGQQLGSVRKDVEDCFGSLKNRFRILKTPVLWHDKDKVDYMFHTCCILHDILLDDGIIESSINARARYIIDSWKCEGAHDFEDVNCVTLLGRTVFMDREYDASGLQAPSYLNPWQSDSELIHTELRGALVTHWVWTKKHTPLTWVRSGRDCL
jgi:hypothetical protein